MMGEATVVRLFALLTTIQKLIYFGKSQSSRRDKRDDATLKLLLP